MKLTIQEEKEVLQEYNTYWDSYITGDVETMISLLDDDYNQIGSAETEVFFNKKDAVKFLYETIDQVAGKAEMRNRIIKVEPLDKYILINDLFDIYVLIETEWTFYSKFRASTLLQKKEEGWKFIHQHSSMPDTRTQEGENIAIEKISKENLQLREAVNRRTVELEQKNRELEIEASLERVRAVAMGMNKSEDLLSICEVSYKEFQKLGFDNLRNTIIHILNDEKEFFLDYDYSDYLGGSINNIRYNSHPIVENYLKQIKRADDAFAEVVIEGDQLDSWKDFRRRGGQPDDPKLDDIQALYYYLYSIGVGDIGISTLRPIDESQINILKRFRNVFDLAYRTYTDITKAEAQAQEAQIEAALERVRARTMAMHKSDDLTSAVATVFEELRKLGLKTIRCGVGIFDGKNRKVNVWTSSSSEKSDSVQVSGDEMLKGHSLLDGIYDSWQRQQDYSYVLKGEDLTKYYNVVADSNLPVKAPEVNTANDIQYYQCVMFPAGGLFAFRESEFSAEAIRLMRRFADVFHLAFIRHLDLKNAEAQNKIIQAENERKTMELEEARELQLSMLPKVLPDLPNLAIAVYMQTATEVGGDYYDFHTGEDGTLTAVIGDATGHGMKAGTMVTITKSLFDGLASSDNILETFDKISKVIKGMKIRQLSMCLMMLKIKDDKLFLSSAAMPPVLIYQKKNQAVEEILVKGMPLGAMHNFPYAVRENHLDKGDTILIMSDGLPELMNDNNEMYGYDRTKIEFHSVGDKAPEEIVDYLKNSASQWCNGKEPDDDVTFVVIKVK